MSFTVWVTKCFSCVCSSVYCMFLKCAEHTATHTGKAEHTATHTGNVRNTLQHTQEKRNTLQHTQEKHSVITLSPTYFCVNICTTICVKCMFLIFFFEMCGIHWILLIWIARSWAPRLILYHTATHLNTLQHTATPCNTLQHPATPGNTLQHSATLCNTLQHSATLCNTLQHSATHYNTFWGVRKTQDYVDEDCLLVGTSTDDAASLTSSGCTCICIYTCTCTYTCTELCVWWCRVAHFQWLYVHMHI